ncbi:MAG: hypothetical protein R2716_01845 [Microthrixaceae bacterium]
MRHMLSRGSTGLELPPEIVSYEDLELNVETYQASIEGRPLDLTYRWSTSCWRFLASSPGRVFTRETLLTRSGATSTTAGPAPSTSTSDACAPSSARSTLGSSRP